MQKHWDVMRSDDAGNSWHEVSGNLPTDFGFVIDVHAHEPETIYVVPIKSDSEHFPTDGKLRVWRSRTGGNEWEPLDQRPAAIELLRQRSARRDGGRFARILRRLFRHDGRSSLRFSRCRRHLDADRPRSSAGAFSRGPDPDMIRVVLPSHLKMHAQCQRRGQARNRWRGHAAIRPRRTREKLSCSSRSHSRSCHATAPSVPEIFRLSARPFARSPRCTASGRGRDWVATVLIVGALAGG